MNETRFVVRAPAKVNLTLHVTGRRADGYHLLDSIVAFADVGDLLSVTPAAARDLTVDGPEAAGVPVDATNLILRVAAFFSAPARFRLMKLLPVASGIGGGSADAAAAWRALTAIQGEPTGACDLARLGADIPVCIASTVARMTGVGETVTRLDGLPTLSAVLVNPRVGVSTPAVFADLRRSDNPGMDLPRGAATDWIGWLAAQRNDLEEAAIRLCPEIGAVRAAIGDTHGCALARMSGSGATCFGLYRNTRDALTAAFSIRTANPSWWVQPAMLGDQTALAEPQAMRATT